jgi:Rrf2 family transcriptional regulator, cysteine metabolism repressor
MRFSTRARYALRLMLDVARNGGESAPVSLAAVAGRTDLSRGYLEQLATVLRNARLLKGMAGRAGGYRLAAPPSTISVAKVIEAAIGPISLVDCLDDPATCLRSDFCECRVVYRLINRRVVEVLEEYTLADLLDPSWLRSHLESDRELPQLLDTITGTGCGPRPRLESKKGAH